jgi:DNA-binding transcriptional regulator YdaS (Cro superfamily)
MTFAAIHRRTLEKALRIVGGQDALATLLCVSREEVVAWMTEEKVLPPRVFVAVVDLISRSVRGEEVCRPSERRR